VVGNRAKVCELGCGTGVFSLIGTNMGQNIAYLVVTDGNEEAVEIAKRNYQELRKLPPFSTSTCEIQFFEFLWGDHESNRQFLMDSNGGIKYDVVLGCELMYYRTRMVSLANTVFDLLHEEGSLSHSYELE
jgi:2-polyprenyl-3-methyl-5-hydroxy-6-metoxy-1,4-benzoquinol methylase